MTDRHKHERSIHVDAAVEDVFRHVEDPAHFVAALAPGHHATLGAVNRTADGSVSSFEFRYREVGRERTALVTREEYVPHRRLVNRTDVGPVHVFTVEPDGTGTTLTYGWDAPRWMKALDAIFVHSDRDVERALAFYKGEIEASG
jgi:hypothetical protein